MDLRANLTDPNLPFCAAIIAIIDIAGDEEPRLVPSET